MVSASLIITLYLNPDLQIPKERIKIEEFTGSKQTAIAQKSYNRYVQIN
jgi:hypothetical protein